ncbi:coil containing protein, partial [Vibrio phage 1.238.B._10N.261.52.F10]
VKSAKAVADEMKSTKLDAKDIKALSDLSKLLDDI